MVLMGGVSRNPIAVIFAMAILVSAPIVHAGSSGLAISGFIETDVEGYSGIITFGRGEGIEIVIRQTNQEKSMDIRDKLSQWKAWHEEGIDNIMEWFGWDYYEM